jgi:hypothetical protein
MNRIKKTKNRIFAAPTASIAMPPNPKTAAIKAMTKNTAAQYNMARSSQVKNVKHDCPGRVALFAGNSICRIRAKPWQGRIDPASDRALVYARADWLKSAKECGGCRPESRELRQPYDAREALLH